MKKKLVLSAAVLLVGAAIGCNSPISSSKKWQAVYLTNSQIYYGHLGDTSTPFCKLSDVYAIQLTPSAQGKDKQHPTLVKIGNDLIGSINEIQINRDQIVFIQDLSDESKLVQGITQLEKQMAAGMVPTVSPSSPAPAAPAPAK
jgi:hypothetical protein